MSKFKVQIGVIVVWLLALLAVEILFFVILIAHHPNYHDMSNFPFNHYDADHYPNGPPGDDPVNEAFCSMWLVLTSTTGHVILSLIFMIYGIIFFSPVYASAKSPVKWLFAANVVFYALMVFFIIAFFQVLLKGNNDCGGSWIITQ